MGALMLVISRRRRDTSGALWRAGELLTLYFALGLMAAAAEPRTRAPYWLPFMAFSVLTAVITDRPRRIPEGLLWPETRAALRKER
jgi:hypothetical protein